MEHEEPTEAIAVPAGRATSPECDLVQRQAEDELMAELPEPKDAPEFMTRLMTDKIHRDYVENLIQGRDIDSLTSRMIAYSLVKYAPEDSPVDALDHYYRTGLGSHAELRAAYMPLHKNPRMEPEGKLLLDILGTHLYRDEHPNRGQQPPTYPLNATLLTAVNGASGARLHFPLQYRHGLGCEDLRSVAAEMCHHVQVKGDPFLAYLRLPGIDASSGDLLHHFELAYRGVAGAGVGPDGLSRGPNEPFGPREISWEAVEIGGQVHVFCH